MRLLGFAVIVAACGSSAPPKAVEPESAPLEIPPLPPQKEPPARPVTREPLPPPPPDDEEADGPIAVPGPLALPCKSDTECVTHRCNTRFGKCAFPCKNDRDCTAGATCFVQAGPAMATCIPQQP
jgi:hypothetical protein